MGRGKQQGFGTGVATRGLFKAGLAWLQAQAKLGQVFFQCGDKRAMVSRAGSCLTLYSENKHRELLPAAGWPYKSKHQLKTIPRRAGGSGHPGRELAPHGEMLQVRAGEIGARQTQPPLRPASPPGTQPLGGSGLSKREMGAVPKKLPEPNWLSAEHPLISTHRCQTLQGTQKAALGLSQLVLIFALGKTNQ